MKERDIQFFRPLWRRVAVTAVCVAWAAFELVGRDPMWIAISVGFVAYAVWILFIRFPKDAPPAANPPPATGNGGNDAPPSA